jgi:toxin ParE1/3/4
MERMPGTGTPHVGELCDIPGLRMRRVEGFPCGWFYFVRPDHLDVVRLLDDAQDLGAILGDLDEAP